LDEGLKPVTVGGAVMQSNVGSTAVLEAIRKYQPLLGLHGHIHESRGDCQIGRTLCINPGSEYSQGILRGVLVILEKEKVKRFALTSG
jgi:Icc-related predicted phosphoesterase